MGGRVTEGDRRYETNPNDPARYLGVYETIEDMPEMYHPNTYESVFADRDVIGEYIEGPIAEREMTDARRTHKQNTLRKWEGFMDDRGRHPALALPQDVEAWLSQWAEDRAESSVQRYYFDPIHLMYTWMFESHEFPHVYHPVRMAACVEGSVAAMCWYRIKNKRS